MSDLVNLMGKLNFTKTEALVYMNLLKNTSLTGYQVAKNLNMSRSSVYSSLDNLYKRGVVFLLPGDSQIYKAEMPAILISNMKKEFLENADELEEKLNSIEIEDKEERYVNLEEYNNIISKAKELLRAAKKEVYINTDFDLKIFSEELVELRQKGVRVIVFSFSKFNGQELPIEIYCHSDGKSQGVHSRFMLVVDFKTTLIADQNKGTFTENDLMASIVSEHIHHDIYLLKLKEKYNKDLIDEDIKINTMMESGNRA